jgi:hypothetical protein
VNKDDLWKFYVAKNPKFEPPEKTVTLTTTGLKKLFDQTYDAGYTEGKKSKSLFEDIFGKT